RAQLALFWGQTVHLLHRGERVELLTLASLGGARWAHSAGDRVALAQVVLLDLVHGDVDILLRRQVARGPHKGIVVHDVDDSAHRTELFILANLIFVCRLAIFAYAIPAATATSATSVVPAVVVAGTLVAL